MNVWRTASIGMICCALNTLCPPAGATEFGVELESSLSLPPVYKGGAGAARLTLSDNLPPTLSYHPICAKNLLDPALSADFYVNAAPNQSGSRSDSWSVTHATTFSDTNNNNVPITPDLAKALMDGTAALTITTLPHPSGEIRGLIYQCPPTGGCPPPDSSHCSP